MALITRIGASNANSFVTLGWAERTLLTLRRDLATWTGLSTAEKEFRLQIAASMIGQLPLRGRRVYRDQALAFPRARLRPTRWRYDEFGRAFRFGWDYDAGDQVIYEWPDDKWEPEQRCRKIPMEVKVAQCLIAFNVVHQTLESNPGLASGSSPGEVNQVAIGGVLVGLSLNPGNVSPGNLFDRFFKVTYGEIYLLLHKWLAQVRGGAVQSTWDANFYRGYRTLPTTTTTTITTTSSTSSTISTTSSTASTSSTSSTASTISSTSSTSSTVSSSSSTSTTTTMP